MADETIILKVQLDEGKTNDRLKVLAVDMAKTRQEQRELKKAYDAGLLSEEAYGAKSVEVGKQLRTLSQENTALTKNLDLYNRAVQGVSGSYDQQQAQLSLAQKQYQQLAGSAENTTEETQALSKVIDELRGTLKTTDAGMGLFVRNVGNYGGAIEPLIQQLVKLREEEKTLEAGSAAASKNLQQQAGFLTAAQRAAASAGKSYDEANTAIENYAKGIQPATAELVKLEQEQARLVDTGEEATETVRRIGFQIGKLEKDLKDVAKEAPALGKLGDEAGKASASLDDVAQVAGPLAPAIEKLSAAKEKYAQVVNLAKVATAGETTALGVLKVALIATGIGAIVVLLGSLIAFLTSTSAGTEFLSKKMGALGAVFNVVKNIVVDFGQKIFEAAQNPKQAFTDLVAFIEQNVINRFKSFGVILDAIRNRDLTKLTDGIIQFGTGVENGTAKLKAFTTEIGKAAAEGERLAAARLALERAEDANIDTNKKLLNQVERLKNVRDNEFNTLAVRRKANEDAYKVEMQRESTLAGIAQQRINLLRAEIQQEGGLQRVSRERRQELKTAELELVDIREDAAGKQNELITNRFQLYKEGLDAEKEATEKAAEANRQQLQVEIGLLDIRLQQVRKNSDEELGLLRRKLDAEYRLELAAKDLTVGQKEVADKRYEAERTRLELDAARARAAEVLQIEVGNTAARLATVRQGGAEELALQQRVVENTRRTHLAAIDARQSAEAQAAQRRAIDAQADRQQDDLLYADKLRKLAAFSQQQRNTLDTDRAQNLVDEKTYTDLLYQQQLTALNAQLALARKFGRDTSQIDQQLTDLKIGNLSRVGDKEREQAQQRIQIAEEFGQAAGQIFADTLADQGKTMEDFAAEFLILILDTIEKALIAQVAASTATATTGSLASPQSVLTGGVAGFAQAAILTAGITAAAGIAKAIIRQALSTPSGAKFEQGGVTQVSGRVSGPRHAQGGIQLWHRSGAHLGEMEGGETILVPGVWQSPLLRTFASLLNQAGGGKALVAGRHMALGGVTAAPAVVRDYLRSGADVIDYDALAHSLAKVKIYTKTQDVKAALDGLAYTEQVLAKD